MPIVGNLSEFPLPEVLLLIGQRTGRLRLLDVPEFGVLDLDVSNGAVQTMHIGSDLVTEARKMVEKLGAIVITQSGMFEFRLVPVSITNQPQALSIHDLAMKLVCHVDEQTRRRQLDASSRQLHRLVVPQPEIWMEPELDRFLETARSLLASGVILEELARKLNMKSDLVNQNLDHLRSLGFIESIDGGSLAGAEAEPGLEIGVAKKSSAFIRVARLTDRIRQLSSRLPAVK